MSTEFSNWSEKMLELTGQFVDMRCRYQSALREVQTKLEILDDEFQMRHSRNPIHHMESRIKSMDSIAGKLQRKGLPLSLSSIQENLYDIAGIRVICSYNSDIYTIARLLTRQDDITLLRERDYIQNPKPNGYRSLHLIVQVPVFLSTGKEFLPVEVQIRTIAMDFWASLEHQIRYKVNLNVPEDMNSELRDVAEKIARLDTEMQGLYDRMVEIAQAAEEERKHGAPLPPPGSE